MRIFSGVCGAQNEKATRRLGGGPAPLCTRAWKWLFSTRASARDRSVCASIAQPHANCEFRAPDSLIWHLRVSQILSVPCEIGRNELPHNRMQVPVVPPNGVPESAQNDGATYFAQPQATFPNLRWKPGVELPLFLPSNPDAIHLCEAILAGTAEVPPIVVSEAVAIQIYLLVLDKQRHTSFVSASWVDYYRILATLALRVIVTAADIKALSVTQLRHLLTRTGATAPGLVPALRFKVGQRHRNELKGMTATDATAHTLKQWDLFNLEFDFEVAPTATGGGGGGGDPGGPSGNAESSPSRPPQTSTTKLDIRTRTLDACLGGLALAQRRLAEARGALPSEWALKGGALPMDILAFIDVMVRHHKLPHQAKRVLTFERQLVLTRQMLDAERTLRAEAQIELVNLALQPQRERRLLEYERRLRNEDRKTHLRVMDALAADAARQAKEARAAHAACLTQLRGDERAARVVLEEQVLLVQTNNTELERQLRAAQRAARLSRGSAAAAEEEAAATRAEATAEVARVKDHARAWARVREAEVCVAGVEAERDGLRERVAELEAQVSSRSQARAAEHAELLTLRCRVTELREKVDSYQARSNRRFFEVDPIVEENEALRREQEQRDASFRQQLHDQKVESLRQLNELNEQSRRQLEQQARAPPAAPRPLPCSLLLPACPSRLPSLTRRPDHPAGWPCSLRLPACPSRLPSLTRRPDHPAGCRAREVQGGRRPQQNALPQERRLHLGGRPGHHPCAPARCLSRQDARPLPHLRPHLRRHAAGPIEEGARPPR